MDGLIILIVRDVRILCLPGIKRILLENRELDQITSWVSMSIIFYSNVRDGKNLGVCSERIMSQPGRERKKLSLAARFGDTGATRHGNAFAHITLLSEP
jgi:hypothetical protein